MNRLFLFVFLLSFKFILLAQKIEINNYFQEGEHIVVDFKIFQANSTREVYTVDIYGSHDNFNLPIHTIKNVRVGQPIRESFNGLDNVGAYSGDFQMKLKARASLFPIQVIEVNEKLKKGKQANISWKDYHNYGTYKIGLYSNGTLMNELTPRQLGTIFNGNVPKNIAKGSYNLRVVPLDNPDMTSDNIPVLVKNRSKMGLIAGVLVLGGGGVILNNMRPEPDPPSTKLPNPPGPPSGN